MRLISSVLPYVILSVICSLIVSCHKIQVLTTDIKQTMNKDKNTLRFLVVGDWGRNGKYHQKDVAEQMNKTAEHFNPSFIISTGDNFYPNGVSSTTDDQWKTSFENIYTGNHLQCPWYIVLGNHDYRGTPQAEIDYTKKQGRWRMPARYYTTTEKIDDSTKVRFIFLDSNPLVIRNHSYYSDMVKQDTVQQLRWLDSVLVNTKEQWKIVIAHHPLYSSNPRHGNSERLINLLKPKLEKYGVQLYLSGHDHDLQHQKPPGTVDYLISGAGSQTRRSKENLTSKFSQQVSGFAALRLTADSLHLHFIDYTGNTIYSYGRGK